MLFLIPTMLVASISSPLSHVSLCEEIKYEVYFAAVQGIISGTMAENIYQSCIINQESENT
jgi:hypothetical protein